MGDLAKEVIKAAEEKSKTFLRSFYNGYEYYIERDEENNNWYIMIRPGEKSWLYDGWWNDSQDKTLEEAVAEGIKGAGIGGKNGHG